MPARKRRRDRAAFTLMEVLLVLVILVILGSLAVGVFGNVQKRANENAAKAQIGLFKTPLELYLSEMHEYPTTNQGLNALIQAPAEGNATSQWSGPKIESIPLDPWGHPYQYSFPGRNNPDKYDVWSLGPDGADGTADDIGNWDNQQQR